MTRPPRARICRGWSPSDGRLFGDGTPWKWECDGDPVPVGRRAARLVTHDWAPSWQAALDALAAHQRDSHGGPR